MKLVMWLKYNYNIVLVDYVNIVWVLGLLGKIDEEFKESLVKVYIDLVYLMDVILFLKVNWVEKKYFDVIVDELVELVYED